MTRRRLLFVTLVVAAVSVVGVAAAWAHASLERSLPADGETVENAPTEIVLEFNEPVSAPVGAVRVFDSAGNRRDGGNTVAADGGRSIVAPVAGVGEGTHIVTWRAVSADGHPIKGAFVFHVGEASEDIEASAIADLLGSGRDRPYGVAAGIARWLTYLASLVAVGAFLFRQLVDRGAPEVIGRLIRVACLVGAAASLLQIPLFAAETTGLGLSALTSGGAWSDAVSGTVGTAALIRIGGFAVMYGAVASGRLALGWVAGATLVAAELVTGHTRTTDPAWLAWVAGAGHVAGAAVWSGGLTAFLLTLRRRRREDDPAEAARLVGRFSALASWSVLVLAAAGATLAWTQVGALRAFTSTTYGWTLITKVAIVGLVLLVAVYNNRVLVPAITGNGEGAQSAWRRLGATVRWEMAGIVVALGVTAMLVNIEPAAEAAGVSAPYSTTVPFGEGQLNVVVDPNRAGTNEIHLYVLTPGGLPAITAGGITLELSLPREEIGPFVRATQFAGPGHFLHTGQEMALPGTWQITVKQRVSEFSEEEVVIPVVVND